MEAAFAGCDTIWIICNDDLAPIVRYRVGDYIQDPIHFYNNFGARPNERRKRIPIFWVPVHAKDRFKRDCLSWSVITGALSCLKIASQLSNWLIPEKYYVSFPYGIIDPRQLQKVRGNIRNKSNFYVTSKGKSVQDNNYSSFTFGKEEFIIYRKNVRQGTGKYTSEVKDERGLPRSKLPIEERWSARYFDLQDVFRGVDINDGFQFEVDEFHNLDNWESYREYMNSDLARDTQRPTKELFAYREFNRIGQDIE